jgi:PBP1b-binding outer membrane lipoprotein LpoB
MKKILPIIALSCLILASCSTQRTAEPKRYQSMQEKAHTTLQLDQRQYSMNASVQVWRNELIILSLQPMLGIEMVRAEVTPDSIVLVDKLNKRYTVMDYSMFEQIAKPALSYKMIQDYVTAPQQQTKKKKSQGELRFQIGQHVLRIQCAFSQREYNSLKSPKRQDLKKYKQTTLREILPI